MEFEPLQKSISKQGEDYYAYCIKREIHHHGI